MRKKSIRTPKKMWELFEKYVDYVKANPIRKMDYRGSDVQKVYIEIERPLTMSGFNVYCYGEMGLKSPEGYFTNSTGDYDNYEEVCDAIRKQIRNHQIDGGMAKIYDPGLTARLNGLTDKQEHTVIAEQPLFKLDD